PTPCRSHPLAATSRPHPSDTRLETPPDERREAEGMPTDREATIRELARAHGLDISGTVTVNELGLDFQVAIAEAADGLSWVLRIPRRPDAANRASVGGRFLSATAPHLSVAVPAWQIHTAERIAYPRLPGDAGVTIDARGGPRSRCGVESAAHEAAAGRDDDSDWPTFTTVTHGEVYPAHQLMDGPTNLSILDWTTAAISDPARDFMFHRASVSAAVFEATIAHYVQAGGRVWPRFADHCAELYSTSPVELGLFALQTGDPELLSAARAQLNPSD